MAKRYPRTVFELKDQDYVRRLSPKDRAYLELFNEEYYNATFSDEPLHKTAEQRRELYSVKNHRNVDIYGRCTAAGDSALEATEAEPLTEHADSSYLSDPGYREALDEFRSFLPSDGRKRTPLTAKFVRSKQKIEALSGRLTSRGKGEFMAKNRVDRLLFNRQVIWNIGATLSQHSFPGHLAPAAAEMLTWVEGILLNVEKKLLAMGVELKPLGPPQSPPNE